MLELYRKVTKSQCVFFLLEKTDAIHQDKGNAPWSPLQERPIYKGYRIILNQSTDLYGLPIYKPQVCEAEVDEFYLDPKDRFDLSSKEYWGMLRLADSRQYGDLLTVATATLIAQEPTFRQGEVYRWFHVSDHLD